MGDITQIADLYTPTVWIEEMTEQMAKYPSLLNSGAVVRSPQLNAIASGPGIAVELPFFKDVSDQDDAIQVESTAPTDQQIISATQKAPVLNRVWSGCASALSAQVSGMDPVGEMVRQLTPGRAKRMQKAALSVLRGAFNGLGANGAAAALSANRLDYFDETGTDADNTQTMDADKFIYGKSLLGELAGQLQNGAIWMHPDIVATLEIADKDSFKNGVESGLPFSITTYRGVPLFVSSELVRAGTTNGYVYETYILGQGVLAVGEKPQTAGTRDVASLRFWDDALKNDVTIVDRTRYLVHLNGMIWGGTPGGQSATNAELYTGTNWTLGYTSAARVGAVCIRTNK